jgi:acyl carrier protein
MNSSKSNINKSQEVIKEISSIILMIIQRTMRERGSKKNVLTISLLQEDLGLTSLDMISLITELCDELKIDIMLLSDLDLAHMHKVEDIITILSSKKIL